MADSSDSKPQPFPKELQKLLDQATPLNPEKTVLLNRDGGKVLLKTNVACEDCPLEMLVCLSQTKEHESVLALQGKAFAIHAALLALGLEPGSPATFSPTFKAPEGPKLDIFVNWVDSKGKLQRRDVHDWIRFTVFRYYSHPLPSAPAGVEFPFLELRYDKFNNELIWYGPMSMEQKKQLLALCSDEQYQAGIMKFYEQSQSRTMTADFVFTGSFHHTDPDSGQKYYAAESGHVICVANFAAALIDVREASSADSGAQSYEAWKGKVPPHGTPVVVEIIPATP